MCESHSSRCQSRFRWIVVISDNNYVKSYLQMIKSNILGSSNRSCAQHTETGAHSFTNPNHRSLFYITLHSKITCNLPKIIWNFHISTCTTQLLWLLLFLWLFLVVKIQLPKSKCYWYYCGESNLNALSETDVWSHFLTKCP